MSPTWGLDAKTDWLTGRQSQCDFGFDLCRHKLEDSRIRQEDVVQGSLVVYVLTLRGL
jgi:hypothetical protein